MGTVAKSDGRDTSTGKFLPGNREHKQIRKKRVPRAILDQAVSDTHLRELIDQGLDMARNGDSNWIAFFLQRYLPAVKPMSPKVQFPLDTTNPTAAIQDVLASVSSGALSSDHGKDLITSIQSLAQVQELEGLKQEIDALRELLQR